MLEVPVSGSCVELSEVPDDVDWFVSVDWFVPACCEVEELGVVIVDCWSALAPLVTLCEPLPTFTPGLTSAPTFAFELATPTFEFTPTLGFTLSEREMSLEDSLDDGLVLDALPEVLELPLDEVVVSLVPLEELPDGLDFEEPAFTSMSVELEELLEGDCGALLPPFTLMSVELEELLDGVDCDAPVPFRLMSVELEELLEGVVDEVEPFTPVSISVREDELAPGTTATPGPISVVVVVLLPCASGALGMQPAGCVFAVSMHFGCSVTFTV